MGASSPRSSRPARWRSTRRGVDVADDDLAEALAALLDVGGAAASLGELTISALATATVVGNAQLVAAGESVPQPAADPRVRESSAPVPPEVDEPEAPAPNLEELLAELDALVGLEA